jgi:nitroreductase
VSDMLETVRARRSVRRYEPREVAPEMIEQLKEAMLRSPSSQGRRPWRFVFVTDREKLAALSRAKPNNASFLAEAALGVVVCGDERVSDAWIEDCSIAATILQLTTTGLGLGSCWIQLLNRPHDDDTSAEAYVGAVLGLGEGIRVECIVAIGYPLETKPPYETGALKWDAVTDV